MKNILESIYDLNVMDARKFRRAKEEKAYDALNATLSEKQSELFDEFYKALMDVIGDEKADVFVYAAKMGIWLGLELSDFKM